MDDDVLELTRKCAEALGLAIGVGCPVKYDPSSDPAQAFELLCWLAERGETMIDFNYLKETGGEGGFVFTTGLDFRCELQCSTPTELRLAIMRAVCKVHEGMEK
jgi:hypothetical protein